MKVTPKRPFKAILQDYLAFKSRLWRNIGQIAVNFFKENFTRQGFLDGGHVNQWKKRNPRMERFSGKTKSKGNRAILMGTGRLRKSIRIVNVGESSVTVGSEMKYAKIHNQGGVITQRVTPRQRAWFWRMFYTTKNEMWRNMALSNTIKIRMPRRKFMGESTDLAREIERFIRLGIIKIFKK